MNKYLVKIAKAMDWGSAGTTPPPNPHVFNAAKKIASRNSAVARTLGAIGASGIVYSLGVGSRSKDLEKTARNQFEKYLGSQPVGRQYDDPRIQKAHDLIHVANSKQEIAKGVHDVGGSQLAAHKYHVEGGDAVRKHRGDILSTAKARVQSPFKNTGDTLGKNRSYPFEYLNVSQEKKKASSGLRAAIKKSPLRTGAILAGALAVSGLAVYGGKKSAGGND